MDTKITRAELKRLQTLQEICIETYTTFFGEYWVGNGLQMYLQDQFGTEKLTSDLNGNIIEYYFIERGEQVVGYLKINNEVSLNGFENKSCCELEKMYMYPDEQGGGIGSSAMHLLIEMLRKKHKDILFLEVLDTNDTAMHFYEKAGFVFHDKTKVKAPNFKPDLSGLHRMVMLLG
ncbi:MAG: GNAT family N-acetyltransferase [Saprospiraceae bacterium]|nr:GNAT family N-acetyltransferase [Saprospiraceae bacterium]